MVSKVRAGGFRTRRRLLYKNAFCKRVGHSSISTLLDIYAHTFPGSQKGIVVIVSEEIKKNGGKMSVKTPKIDNRE